MSEGRQLAIIIVSLIALAGVGIGGAILFPEPCEGLEREGSAVSLRFQDAEAVLALSADDAAAVQGLGDALGIGGWRGGISLSVSDQMLPTEAGFLIAQPAGDLLVARPTFGVVSPPRSYAGLQLDPASGSFALTAADGESGVFDGQLEMDHCGTLDPLLRRVEAERGLVVAVDGRDTVVVGLDGGEQWRVADREARWAELSDNHVVIGDDSEITLHNVRTGEVLDELEAFGHVAAGDTSEQILLETSDGLVELTVVEDGLVLGPPLLSVDVLGNVREVEATPLGIVAVAVSGADDRLITDRNPAGVELPGGLTVSELLTSHDGYVAIVVQLDGGSALLVWGPDANPA